MRTISLLLLSASCAGCYASHERGLASVDGGVALDASTVDAPTPDALTADATSPACGPVTTVLDVPARGCVEQTIPSTAGNSCGRGDGHASQLVRVRRPSGGARWYFLIRSRDPAATQISIGVANEVGCSCQFQASTTGGDLTAHGIGGDIANEEREIDLVLDGDERAIWLRVCDTPPR